MPYWRPNAAQLDMIRRHVLKFGDGPVPVMTYLIHHSSYRFDPYTAFLRNHDDTPIGQAEFVGVRISVGFSGKRKNRFLIFPMGEIEFDRDFVGVERTVFVAAHRLPNGRDVGGCRITKTYASKLILRRPRSVKEQDSSILEWAEPHVRKALEHASFKQEMIDGLTKMRLALDTVPTRPRRHEYEEACQRFRCKPREDDELFAVKGGNRLPRGFPEVSPLEAICNRIHLLRQFALDDERSHLGQ